MSEAASFNLPAAFFSIVIAKEFPLLGSVFQQRVLPFYRERIRPQIVNRICSFSTLAEQRKLVVPHAEGLVVEVGIGTGLNLPFYDSQKVQYVIGVNPPDGLTTLLDFRHLPDGVKGALLTESAEDMSLRSQVADTVVVTYTMCAIPDIERAIREMHRILKPGGRLIYCECGRASNPMTASWQTRMTRFSKHLLPGCHLDRVPAELLEANGFDIEVDERYPLPGVPSLIGFHHVGSARPRPSA